MKDERKKERDVRCCGMGRNVRNIASVSHYYFNYRSPSWRLIAIRLPRASGTHPDSTITKGKKTKTKKLPSC